MTINNLFCTLNPNANNSLPLLKLNVQNTNSIPPRQNFGAFHWHYDLQFVLVLHGSISVQTLNQEYIIEKGNAIYINKCILHRITEKNCNYHSFIFPENLLPGVSTQFFNKFVVLIIHNQLIECIVFLPNSLLLSSLLKLDELDINNPQNELLCVELLYTTWQNFYNEFIEIHQKNQIVLTNIQSSLEHSLLFIHQNYSLNIQIEDIANIAHISKSSLLRYFTKILHTTPYDYLIDFRIKKVSNY